MNKNLLEIRNLAVEFHVDEGTVHAVNGVNLTIRENETVAIVGESGSGKSVTSYAVMGLLPPTAQLSSGSILYHGYNGQAVDLTALGRDSRELRQLRGGEVAMIFQEPMTALSPVHTVGSQILEVMIAHLEINKQEARRRGIKLLATVGIPDPEHSFDRYSFEFSGGMRQRVMIAIALACNPRLLIADEPTSALDVTIQAQILDLLRKLQQENGMAIVFITHNMGVVAEIADQVAVMYLGRIVEHAAVEELFDDPKHPYTQALMRSIPGTALTGQGKLHTIPGSVPHALEMPSGCPFHPRCDKVIAGTCDHGSPPPLRACGEGAKAACVLYD